MDQQTRTLAIWAKTESAKIATDWPLGSRAEKELIQHWRRVRPQMVARLQETGALAALAHVLNHKMIEALQRNRAAGMPPTDAREEAEKDWLLMEPEAEDEETSQSPSPLARIISSMTPSN